MPNIVVVFQKSVVDSDRIGTIKEAEKLTKEKLVVDETNQTWRFADTCQFSLWGSFEFGKGPTSQQQHDRYWYPNTLTVFDRTNVKQIETVFRTIRADVPAGSGEPSWDDD